MVASRSRVMSDNGQRNPPGRHAGSMLGSGAVRRRLFELFEVFTGFVSLA